MATYIITTPSYSVTLPNQHASQIIIQATNYANLFPSEQTYVYYDSGELFMIITGA